MKRTVKKIIAFACVLCMIGTWCLEGMPALVKASESTDQVLLTDLKEQGYDYRTYFDLTGYESMNGQAKYSGHSESWDKMIFTAKMCFPDSFGSNAWEIGYSDYHRFRIQDAESGKAENIRLRYMDYNTGELVNAELSSEVAGVQLRGNDNLTFSISVEFVGEPYQLQTNNGTKTVTDLKVGVFINEKLYNNQYFEAKGITVDCAVLSMVHTYDTANKTDIVSHYPWKRTLDTEKLQEDGYDYWTLDDAGISKQVVSGTTITGTRNASVPWDKNIFTAKVEFPSGNFGSVEVGHNSASEYRFRFNNTDGGLQFRYMDGGTGKLNLTLTDAKAGVSLRDNENLVVSIVVENVVVTKAVNNKLRVGLYFDDVSDDKPAKLYNNQYVTSSTVTLTNANGTGVRVQSNSGFEMKIASHYLWGVTELEELKSQGYDYRTYFDLTGYESMNGQAKYSGHSESWDKMIFTAKMCFPDSFGSNAWEIGYSDYHRFRIQDATSSKAENIRFRYIDYNTGDLIDKELSAEVAGVKLRGNENLTFSISVEFVGEPYQFETKNGMKEVTDLKVGVFINEKLYNNQYFEAKGITLDCAVLSMVHNYDTANKTDIVSYYPWERTMDTEKLQEEGYDYWTLTDAGISNQVVSGTTISGTRGISVPWDKNIFTAKVEFPSGNFGAFEVGHGNAELYRFRFNDLDGGLRFRYMENSTAYIDTTLTDAKAGVSLRENENLVVFIVVKNVVVTKAVNNKIQVGLYFDDVSDDKPAKLYNNQYITSSTVTLANANGTGVRVQSNSTFSMKIASHYLWGTKITDLKEQGYDYRTYFDLTGYESMNGSAKYSGHSESWDKMIFTAKMCFPDSFGSNAWQIGYSDYHRFRIQDATSGKAGNLRFRYIDYNTGDLIDTELSAEVAGVKLRGNENLTFSISVEFVGNPYTHATKNITVTDLKVGVFINEKLYNNQYFEAKGITLNCAVLSMVHNYDTANKTDIVSHYPWERTMETEKLREEGYDYWTMDDAGISNQVVSSTTITGSRGASEDWDKTIFTAQVKFPSGNFGAFEVGHGNAELYRFRFNNVDGGLRFRYMENSNAYIDATLTDAKAGVSLRDNENLVVSIVVENVIVTKAVNNKIQVALYFDDVSDDKPAKLYNNQYITSSTVALANANGTGVRVQSNSGFEMKIASHYLWEETDNTQYEKLTFRDFGIGDGKYGYEEDSNGTKKVSTKGTYEEGAEALDQKALVGIVKYTGTAGAELSIAGTTEWYGIRLKSDVVNNRLQLRIAPADIYPEYYLYSNTAGVELIDNKFDLKMTFAFVDRDGGGTENDLKLGVYFNDKLYSNTFFYYNNYVDEHLGNNMSVLADQGGYVRVASDRSDLEPETQTYNLDDGSYVVSGEENIEITPLGKSKETYTVENVPLLTKVGQYFVSTCDNIYEKTVLLYRSYDGCLDDKVDAKDLVVAKKLQNNVDPATRKDEVHISKIAIDINKNNEIDDYDVAQVRDRLCK